MDEPVDRREVIKSAGGSVFAVNAIDLSTTHDNTRQKSRINTQQSGTKDSDLLYLGANNARLHAVDAQTGERKWSLAGATASAPTVVNGHIFGTTSSGTVTAVSEETRQIEWETAVEFDEEPDLSAPTVANGMVYVGGSNAAVYALHAVTGEEIWSNKTLEDSIYFAPHVVGETVYVGSWNATTNSYKESTLYALNARDGTERWVYNEPQSVIQTSPTATEETVFVSSADKTLYSVDSESGLKNWDFLQPYFINHEVCIVDGSVYLTDGIDLYALDKDDGSQLWSTKLEPADDIHYRDGIGSPSVVNGTVHLGTMAFDADTGEEQWRLSDVSESGYNYEFGTPTVAENTVYVPLNKKVGQMVAVDAETGERLWTYEGGDTDYTSATYVSQGEQHSVGSRVQLGIGGHHFKWAGTTPSGDDWEPPSESAARETETTRNNELTSSDGPGFGIGSGVAGIAGAGYVLYRGLQTDDD